MLIALLIFLITIVLVIWQPRGLGVGWSASFGALLALLSGVVELADIALVLCMWRAGAAAVGENYLPLLCCWAQRCRRYLLMMVRR